jgi:tetratricopeptide (TPR) repeat protein
MKYLLFLLFAFTTFAYANEVDVYKKPLVERYVLDELRELRNDYQKLQVNVAQQIANNKVQNNDRVIEYTTQTLNNIFYIVTIAASLLVLLGWRSISDVKNSIDTVVNKKIDDITQKYEERLDEMEQKIRSRSNEIIANQEEISNTNVVHSLWMRAGLEKSNREKLKLYDQILEIKNDDIEALTYKADVLLDMDKAAIALELADKAIQVDGGYALAYWQRACARAELNIIEESIDDIRKAISISHPLFDKINDEVHFNKLHDSEEFKKIVGSAI